MSGRSWVTRVVLAVGCCAAGAATVNGCSSRFTPEVAPPGVACPGSSKTCAGSCVDVAFDPKNCGDCGAACAAGEVCSSGKCGSSCGGGTKKCGDKCVDSLLDAANCGDCAKPCAAGEVCAQGNCGLTCVGGTKLCGAPSSGQKCVDTQLDAQNCGDCGKPCGTGEACVAGKCGCAAGFTKCEGGCFDFTADAKNCGNCGVACIASQDCVAGACRVKRFGTGADGDVVVKTTETKVLSELQPVVGSYADHLALLDGTVFKVGDNLVAHRSRQGNAGEWELATVVKIDANDVYVAPKLHGDYGSLAGGQAIRVPQYNSVTIASGGALTAPAWNGLQGGILAFMVKGKLDVQAGGVVTMLGKGSRGDLSPPSCQACGAGLQGESIIGTPAYSSLPNGTGGGAGLGGDSCSMGGGGGHATKGGSGVNNSTGLCKTNGNASGGLPFGVPSLTSRVVFGGAGGEGGRSFNGGYPGVGGNGGGIILIFANNLTVAGLITANGGKGGNGVVTGSGCGFTGCGMGGGGGGAGGAIRLDVNTATLGDNLVVALGAGGGFCDCGDTTSGVGGEGRIHVVSPMMMPSGQTNPVQFVGP